MTHEMDEALSARKDHLWKLSSSYLSNDVSSIQKSLVQHVEYTLARRRYKFDRGSFYQATAHSVRDRLIERWTDTQQFYASRDGKRMYYLSLEFLVGRSMGNAVSNLGLRGVRRGAAPARIRFGGHHGAGEGTRARQRRPGSPGVVLPGHPRHPQLPAWGYGLRYKYGMFEQRLINGKQVEFPDYWLTYGNPWEVERLDVKYLVRLYGHVATYVDEDSGETRFRWEGGEVVVAVAYDTPIPGTARTTPTTCGCGRRNRATSLTSRASTRGITTAPWRRKSAASPSPACYTPRTITTPGRCSV